MNSTKTRSTQRSKKQRAARERQAAYATRTTNGKSPPLRARAKKLVVEMYGGEPYEFYPLGRFVVIAPVVADKAPVFKYTRIRAKRALDLIGDGATIDEVAQKFDNAFVPPAAIQEALELARKAFAKAHPSLRKGKRIV